MILDLSHEESLIPDFRRSEGHGWLPSDRIASPEIMPVTSALLTELDRAVADVETAPPKPQDLRVEDFALPGWQAFVSEVRGRLDRGPGFAVIDRLPLDRWPREIVVALFWVLGQLLERPVAQKWDGTLLYQVRDTGQAFGYGVRGSYTNIELNFHTDNAFDIAPPDYVGLCCLQPAKRGGVSRFCSLYTVQDRLMAENPLLLKRLYHSVLFDRQAEHAPDAPKVARAPVFRWADGRLQGRVNVSLIRKGYELAGQSMDDETRDAVDALERVAEDPDIWVEMPLERGQVQYLNNRDVAHYRSHYVDADDPALRRHLVRTWHRAAGSSAYDGQ